jgi:cytochrome c biogenesis protein CcdA
MREELNMSKKHRMLPVWFFVGVLLTLYGIIILFTSILQFSHAPDVAFARYHAGIWGGIILLLIGGFYTMRFRPRGNRSVQK